MDKRLTAELIECVQCHKRETALGCCDLCETPMHLQCGDKRGELLLCWECAWEADQS